MVKYFLRKFLVIIIALVVANFIGFSFAFLVSPQAMTGNPYAHGSAESFPVIPAYSNYLVQVLHGDFGTTYSGENVLAVVERVGMNSLGLMGIALLISVVGGLSLGRLSVRRNKRGIAPWLTVLSTIGLASPAFYIAVLLIFLAIKIYLSGSVGEKGIPFIGFGWDTHLILPVLALSLQPMVKIARLVGGLLADEMDKLYVQASLGFGMKFSQLKRKFAFRSIISSVIHVIAGSSRLMLAELIIIERLFNWPGYGKLLGSILSLGDTSADFLSPPMVAILITILAAFFLLIDLVATSLARSLDPRLWGGMEQEQAARSKV